MVACVAAIIAVFVASIVAAARPGSGGAARRGTARVVLATAHAARPIVADDGSGAGEADRHVTARAEAAYTARAP